MQFEEYARGWLDRQDLIKSTRKTTRQALDVYILPVIGDTELEEISEENIDSIFASKRLFKRGEDFTERTFRVLISIFDELTERHIISKNPVSHVYNPVVLANEMLILEGLDVELSSDSPFVQVSCMWLKSQKYKKVTYDLYLHFLTTFVHPFIGKKPVGLVDQNNIRSIYSYFNTVATNETWIGQIHLVMRMVFEYAMERQLVSSNPMMRINDPHLKPIIPLDREKKNAVRAAFSRYGFRKNRLKELSHELFMILSSEEEYQNRTGIPRSTITFGTVYEKWFSFTQDGVLSENTSKSSFHSMDIYMLPNIGMKPIQKVSPTDIRAILDVFVLMGNTSDFYILAKLRSLFDYAVHKGYVSENIASDLRSANNRAAEKLILSDDEIKEFLHLCDESESMYGYLFGVILCTGLRIREGLDLSYKSLDTELSTLKITNQIKDGKLFEATKTRRGRKIRLSQTALFFIDKARILQEEYAGNSEYANEHKLIFCNQEGKPLSYTNVNRRLDGIALKMGRPDITAHTLRHTYMTVSSRCGENLDEIQSEVGHGYSSDVITEYLHDTEESRHESAIRRQEYLEKIINGRQNNGE